MCSGVDADNQLSLQLGFAASAGQMLDILRPGAAETPESRCRREIFLAQVRADKHFVVGIALFFTAIFFFVGALRRLAALDLFFGAARPAADRRFRLWRFRRKRRAVPLGARGVAGRSHAGGRAAAAIFPDRLGALALAALALCAFWTSRSKHWLIVFPRIFALAAAGVLGWAILRHDPCLAGQGLVLVFVVALLGMGHAFLVAVIPERSSSLKNSTQEAAP